MSKIEKWNLLLFMAGLMIVLRTQIMDYPFNWFGLFAVSKGGLFFMFGDKIISWLYEKIDAMGGE